MTIDLHSATWLAVKALAEKETTQALDAIASEGIKERDADTLRGRIAAFRAVLKLADPPRARTTTDPYYNG